jgi:hypothetical protein
VSYCSGIPYATHYIGQALPEPAEKGGPPGPPLLFVAPRSAFKILDDWGQLIGLVGSGSNSIVFDKAVVPAHWVLEKTHMADVDPSGGTIGSRLHGNPMYATRGIAFFTMTVGAVMVGAALGALDEFAQILRTRKTMRAPFVPWAEDPDHQRWFGIAITKLKIAEIAVVESAALQMEYGRATVKDGRPYTFGDDQLVACRSAFVSIGGKYPVRSHECERGTQECVRHNCAPVTISLRQATSRRDCAGCLLRCLASIPDLDLPLRRLKRSQAQRKNGTSAAGHGNRLEPLQHRKQRVGLRRGGEGPARIAALPDVLSRTERSAFMTTRSLCSVSCMQLPGLRWSLWVISGANALQPQQEQVTYRSVTAK